MTYRRYTRKEKVSAVTAAAASSVLAAAQESGIPRTTLRSWLQKPEYDELRQKTREELADQWRVLTQKALARLDALIETMEPRDLTTLAGTGVDKSQLLAGEATHRTELRKVTDGLDDHEKQKLRDVLNAELDKRGETV